MWWQVLKLERPDANGDVRACVALDASNDAAAIESWRELYPGKPPALGSSPNSHQPWALPVQLASCRPFSLSHHQQPCICRSPVSRACALPMSMSMCVRR
jgi:hypothetical protein